MRQMRETKRARYSVPISADMPLAESITIFLDQPSNMDKLGDKASMLPPNFTFSVIFVMEE